MHPRLEIKLKKLMQLYPDGFPFDTPEEKQEAINNRIEQFKTNHLIKKTNEIAIVFAHTHELINAYNWENDKPTEEFLILLATEKI